MSGFGTDILALACIAGSAATSGALTLAFMDGPGSAQADCAVEAFSVAPNVVVSGRDGARAVVLATPRVHVHASHDCRRVVSERVRIRMEGMQREMEEARIRVEAARARAEQSRARAEIIRLQGDQVRHLLEEARERTMEAKGELEDARIQEIQFLLQKAEKGGGGQMD